MTIEAFEHFKQISQSAYAADLASVEDIPLEVAARYASEQFDRLAPIGLDTQCQLFFDVIETESRQPAGYLWLGIQNRFEKKVVSINDIAIHPSFRGRGLGKLLMKFVEVEAAKAHAAYIRLHVFNMNNVAKHLYLTMGFAPTSIDMRKDLSYNSAAHFCEPLRAKNQF